MKKVLFLTSILILTLMLSYGVSLAGNGSPSGKHWQFNIIGHPKNVDAISGDDSNGRAIMIPLKNVSGPNQIVCEADQAIVTDDIAPTWVTSEPTGAKI